jgi:alginate O-acetyltransferase complex protein AlgI
MLFNSPQFVLLVLVTALVYYARPFAKAQVGLLTLSSFVFYAYGQPLLLVLLVISALVNGVASYRVLSESEDSVRRRWATIGVVVNLSVLAFFKYNRLLALSIYGELTAVDGVGHLLLTIPLPIGISFYTFQGISLVVDVFREERGEGSEAAIVDDGLVAHLRRTVFFISFFPQLVAGPIVKAHDFFPQIRLKRFGEIAWAKVSRALILGYFLKIVIADNMQHQTFWITYPYFELFSTLELCVLLFGYSMQIFADFAGYSLIAIGIAAFYGYHLPDNFNFPYIAQSFSGFWRRWHISLSTWLKTYLYVPLGGNRRGPRRIYFNLMMTMFLGGLWHGAAWSYAVWGTWHGVALAIERPLLKTPIYTSTHPLMVGLRMLVVFVFVTMAWLLFKLPNFDHVLSYMASLANNTSDITRLQVVFTIACYALPVVAYHLLYLLGRRGLTWPRRLEPAVYGALLFAICVNHGDADAFIYFQF